MIPGGGGPLAMSSGAASASMANMPAIERSKTLALLADPATAKGVRVSGSQAAALGLPPGDWESVGFWFATRDTIYNAIVPTKNDSTEMGPAEEIYLVTAHSSTAGMFAASEPAFGHSVDNLAPGLTAGFAGNESAAPPGLALSWTPNSASDLWKYNIHRGDDELFVPDVSNLLGTTDGTTLLDAGWVKAYMYFYKLVAVDRHGNESPAALLRPEDIKVGTMLQSFAASLSGAAVEISWTLSEIDETAVLEVLRSIGGGEFDGARFGGDRAERALVLHLSDKSVEPGTTYRYRVNVVEGAGSRTLFETEAISTPAMPLTLNQNHPNPFNPVDDDRLLPAGRFSGDARRVRLVGKARREAAERGEAGEGDAFGRMARTRRGGALGELGRVLLSPDERQGDDLAQDDSPALGRVARL